MPKRNVSRFKPPVAEGLTHWRDHQPADRVVMHRPYGHGVPPRRYRIMTDNQTGKRWLCALDDRGMPTMRKRNTARRIDGVTYHVKELRYTDQQYDMMRAVIWWIPHGLSYRGAFQLLERLGFPQHPGQTPLTVRKIVSWNYMRLEQANRGLSWP